MLIWYVTFDSKVGASPLAHLIELGSAIVVPVVAVVNSIKYSLIILVFDSAASVMVNEDD